MDNRFLREKNLSHKIVKKNHPPKNPPAQDSSPKNSEDTSFVSYFLDAYKKSTKNHVFRDTILLSVVLLCVLFTISLVLPKAFSFRFDVNSLMNIFQSSDSTSPTEEEAGNLDILIL
jgi:hypothetical protein